MDQINTRELASITWGVIIIMALIFYSIKNSQLRYSLITVIKAFFQIKIITSILLITTYVLLSVFILYQIQIWDFSQLKNTFFWYIFFAIGTMFSLNTIKENSHNFFIETIKSSVNLSILLQFIINFHTFNYLLELIILIPLITFLSIISAVANQTKDQILVKKLCNFLLAFIFLIFFIHFIIQTFKAPSTFINYQALQDFFIPIILTILYLPFLWFFLLYIKYEEIFMRLHIFIKNKKLIRPAKFLVIMNFRTQKDLIDEWFHHIKIHKIENYKQLIDSFSLIKHRKTKRSELSNTPLDLGWNVHQAENFLSTYELQVKYSDIGDEIWFGSKLIKLDDDFNPSTLTYYIQGNEDAVKQLKIQLYLYDINLIPEYLNIYSHAIDCLLQNSLQISLKEDHMNNIYNLENFSDMSHGKLLEFQYEKFTHSAKPICELSFCIKNPS
jgi:hypothetical protein